MCVFITYLKSLEHLSVSKTYQSIINQYFNDIRENPWESPDKESENCQVLFRCYSQYLLMIVNVIIIYLCTFVTHLSLVSLWWQLHTIIWTSFKTKVRKIVTKLQLVAYLRRWLVSAIPISPMLSDTCSVIQFHNFGLLYCE